MPVVFLETSILESMSDLNRRCILKVYFNVKVSKNKTFFCDEISILGLKKIGGTFLENRM